MLDKLTIFFLFFWEIGTNPESAKDLNMNDFKFNISILSKFLYFHL